MSILSRQPAAAGRRTVLSSAIAVSATMLLETTFKCAQVLQEKSAKHFEFVNFESSLEHSTSLASSCILLHLLCSRP